MVEKIENYLRGKNFDGRKFPENSFCRGVRWLYKQLFVCNLWQLTFFQS